MQGTKLGVAALLRCQLSHCANLQLHLPQLADSSKVSDADDGPAPLLPAPQVARALAPRARFNVVIVTPACTPADNVGLQAALKVDPHLSRWAVHHDCVMIFRLCSTLGRAGLVGFFFRISFPFCFFFLWVGCNNNYSAHHQTSWRRRSTQPTSVQVRSHFRSLSMKDSSTEMSVSGGRRRSRSYHNCPGGWQFEFRFKARFIECCYLGCS